MTASSRLCTQEHVPSLLPCQVFRNVAFLFSVNHCSFMDILSFFLNPLWWSQSDHPTYISWNPPEKGLCCLKNWLYFRPAGDTQLVARYHGNSRNLNNQLKKILGPSSLYEQVRLWSCGNLREVSTMVGVLSVPKWGLHRARKKNNGSCFPDNQHL